MLKTPREKHMAQRKLDPLPLHLHRPLPVHDPVDAAIQIGAIELEEIPQYPLELHARIAHACPAFHKSAPRSETLTMA
jgi:hypothetical protein